MQYPVSLTSIVVEHPEPTECDFQKSFQSIKEELLIAYDKLYRISSRFEDLDDDRIRCRTFIRDARTQSKDHVFASPNPESPEVLSIDFMLRSLMLMRAIHFTIAYKIIEIDYRLQNTRDDSILRALIRIKAIYSSQLPVLVGAYTAATYAENLASKAKMDKAEKVFNTKLAEILHTVNLDEGIRNEKDFEQLLFRYRTYSSVLDPALAMQTIFYVQADGAKEPKIFQETALPITTKTAAQKTALLNSISCVDLAGTERNFHTFCSGAEQEVNCAFRDLIMMDNRMLGPQARKMIPFSLKNAYVVSFSEMQEDNKKIFIPANLNPVENHIYTYIRLSMPVYIGQGEQINFLIQYAKENIVQLQQFLTHISLQRLSPETKRAILKNTPPRYSKAESHLEMEVVRDREFDDDNETSVSEVDTSGKTTSPRLNFYVLVTNAGPWLSRLFNDNGEHKMSEILKKVHENNPEISITQVPLNLPGRFFTPKFIGPHSNSAEDYPSSQPLPSFSKGASKRVDATASMALQNACGAVIQVISCASARDRTGVLSEELVAKISQTWYKSITISEFHTQHIRSLHNVVLGNLNTPPGCTGLDPGSLPMEYFSFHDGSFFLKKSYFGEKNDPLLFRPVSHKIKRAPLEKMPSQFYLVSKIAKEEYQIARNNLCIIIHSACPQIRNAALKLMNVIDAQFARNNHDEINLLTAVLQIAALLVSDNSPKNLLRFENLQKKIKGHIHPKPIALGTLLFAIGVMLCVTGIHGIYFSEKDISMISPLGLSLMIFFLGVSLSACGGSYACFGGCAEGHFTMPKVLKEMTNFSQAVTSSADHNAYVIEVDEHSPLLLT